MQVEASSAEDTSDISVLWQIKPYPWRLFAKLNRYRFLQQPIRVGFVCLRHLLLLLQVSVALPQLVVIVATVVIIIGSDINIEARKPIYRHSKCL